MKLNRLDFIASLEKKQMEYVAAKADSDLKREIIMNAYKAQVEDYRKEILALLTSGKDYEVDKNGWGSSLTVSFPQGTVIPQAPTPPRDRESEFYATYGGHTTRDYTNRKKLLDTLMVSKEVEVTLTKQLLDLV